MAEKYGTIPPKFTKPWWDYFWTYYKLHVLSILFIIFIIITTVYQVATRPHYDLNLTYAGNLMFPEEIENSLIEKVTPLCDDVDGNGEKSIFFMQMNMASEDFEYTTAMIQKLQLTIAEDEAYIYIMDAETAAPYISKSKDESIFVPLSEWCKEDILEDKIYSQYGTEYGVDISACKVFKELEEKYNADFSGNYIFIRYYPREDQLKKQLDGYNAAKKLAANLVK